MVFDSMKLTEENVKAVVAEIDTNEELANVSKAELARMEKDYEELFLTNKDNCNKAIRLEMQNQQLVSRLADREENLAASRKLRKRHEREIELLRAELEAADKWKAHVRTLNTLSVLEQKAMRQKAELDAANARYESLKTRYLKRYPVDENSAA
jgi:hypothetical protein